MRGSNKTSGQQLCGKARPGIEICRFRRRPLNHGGCRVKFLASREHPLNPRSSRHGKHLGPSADPPAGASAACHRHGRKRFDEQYGDLKLTPVVGLICAYEEEANIGDVLRRVP